METLMDDGENKIEFDDSGVQDVGKQTEMEEKPGLLDLSDDVLLCILKYCEPMDLKALGFTCPRLGRLIRDRTLWTRVDARSHPTGRLRLRWLLAHVLGANTVELRLRGHAATPRGTYDTPTSNGQPEKPERKENQQQKKQAVSSAASANVPGRGQDGTVQINQESDALARLQRLYAQSRYTATPTWPGDGPGDLDPEEVVMTDGCCPGPQFTLTQCMLRQMRLHCSLTALYLDYCNINCNTRDVDPEEAVMTDGCCPGPQFTLTQCMLRQMRLHCSLTALYLDFCNINCNTTSINQFPPKLKRLSLKGSKCYNLPLDKSFLFNIQDYLPDIEFVDLSECEWLEPASLLPLSKAPRLKHLVMQDCCRLSEFVAYASLATRYGFRTLEILDLRRTPVADSEVSALGWLPVLQELYVSPAPRLPDEPRGRMQRRSGPPGRQLEPWEAEEPEYFQIKPRSRPAGDPANLTPEESEQLQDYENNLCLHGIEYHLCREGAWRNGPPKPDPPILGPDGSPEPPRPPITPLHSPLVPHPMEQNIIEVSLLRRQRSRRRSFNPLMVEPQPDEARSRFIDPIDQADPEDKPGPSKRVRLVKEDENSEEKMAEDASGAKKDVGTNTSFQDIPGPFDRKRAHKSRDHHDEAKRRKKDSDSSSDDDSDEPGPSNKPHIPKPETSSNSKDEKPGCSGTVHFKNDNAQSMCKRPPDWLYQCELDAKKLYKEKFEAQPGCSKDADKPKDDAVNEGASTSKVSNHENQTKNQCCREPNEHPEGCKCKIPKYEYVRFRQNMDPEIISREQLELETRGRSDDNQEARPRAHVLYVNVGQQLHTVYRLSILNEPPVFYSFAGSSHLRFRPNVGNIVYSPPSPHLNANSLVSDTAVRRFGRADVDDVNVVHIGPRIMPGDPTARPDRSSLRVLSLTGFRNITDRSLAHLATAAPNLRSIDFSETRVTAQGVENFKSLRPDCQVTFSPYKEEKEEE